MSKTGTYYMHYRRRDTYGEPLPKGGATLAIRPLQGDQIAVSMALCSERDLFNKKLGRSIATGRLNAGVASTAPSGNIWTIAAVDPAKPIKEVVNEAFAVTMGKLGLE